MSGPGAAPPELLPDVAALRAAIAAARSESPDARVALVPTMGALHEGHLTLCDRAREHAEHVVVSIFVNPTQFAPHEDLDRYPRTLDADLRALTGRGVRWVFAPSASEVYPPGFQTEVRVTEVSQGLCADSRPHFFGGVALVVLKLLNAAMADVAVFGEKDWQQLQVIRRMARDLNHPTTIVGAPLIRDPDGLAMSSRNAYLDAPTRQAALALPRALADAAAAVTNGTTDAVALRHAAIAAIEAAGGVVDYVTIADEESLQTQDRVASGSRIFAAASFGGTRLIDNLALC